MNENLDENVKIGFEFQLLFLSLQVNWIIQ